MQTWLAQIPALASFPATQTYIQTLFLTHIESTLYFVRKNLRQAIDHVALGKVAAVCHLFQQLLWSSTGLVVPMPDTDEGREKLMCNVFFFSLIWGVGGNLVENDLSKFDTHVRNLFNEVREVRCPGMGLVFDYMLDLSTQPPTLKNWDECVPKFEYKQEIPFFDILVPTVSTVKFSFLLETLALGGHAVLFTGTTGVGKSVIAKNSVYNMVKSNVAPVILNFSAQSSAVRTQEIIESKLEKKRKNILGAPNNKKIVLFVDDLNMPKLDTYGAQVWNVRGTRVLEPGY